MQLTFLDAGPAQVPGCRRSVRTSALASPAHLRLTLVKFRLELPCSPSGGECLRWEDMAHIKRFQYVRHDAVARYGPGDEPPAGDLPRAGDFILTHGKGFISQLIRFGQWLRFHGPDRKYAHWNHAALVVDSDGGIVEAQAGGVKRNTLSEYRGSEYYLVRVTANDADRAEVAAFGNWCVDQPYDFMTIISLAITNLTGCKFSFYVEGHQICSGLVARAEERTQAIFNRDPSHISPADLAKYYQVEPI